MHRLSLLLALMACTPDPRPDRGPPPADVSARKVIATLKEADRLAQDGQADAAERAWVRAHSLFEDGVQAPVAMVYGPRQAVLLEYRFARVRVALDDRTTARDDIAVLEEKLSVLFTD